MWWKSAFWALQALRNLSQLTMLGAGRVGVALLLTLCLTRPAQAQTVNIYTNTTVGTINDVDCGSAGRVIRTINVPTSYIIGDVDLGVFLSHTYRSDLRITLRSPAGTTVAVMTNTSGSGDNLNDLFDDEAATAIASHNATVTDPLTPLPPAYSHSFRPTAPLSAFDGQNALGNWTFEVCNSVAADTGQFRRADLYITSTGLGVTKNSSVVSDGVSGANPKFIPGAVVRYCILITNNGKSTAPNASVNHSTITSSDVIPATETFVDGSMFTGTSCAGATTAEDNDNIGADESDPFGMAISGSTITGSAASLAPGASFAMVFNVTIN